MKKLFVLIILGCFVTGSQTVIAQQASTRFRTSGGELGLGNTFSDNTTYKMVLAMADFSWSFHRRPLKNDFMAWYCNPQFNIVHSSALTNQWKDVEFGVNLGFRNYIHINDKLYFYQMLGSGPHYISARLNRQATGFIFSDNLAVGSLIHLHKSTFLNIQAGIRHISNANLKLPNRGVNSFIIMLGLSGIR